MKVSIVFFSLISMLLSGCDVSHAVLVEESQTAILLKGLDSLGIQYEVLEEEPLRLSLRFRQSIDHEDTQRGTYIQKAHFTFNELNAPNILYLSGYDIKPNSDQTELTALLNANQLYLEHRYFGESLPTDSIEKGLLTIHQSVEDIHQIKELLGSILKGPWASTGISKGGQTVMYHKAFYPDDVKASVVYVAPLNMEEEDSRIQDFLMNVGALQCREAIKALQLEIFMNYDLSLGLFKELATKKEMFPSDSWEEFFELSVFEYEFAFWQWNAECPNIPGAESDLRSKVEHLFKVGSPGFFTSATKVDLFPFFFQAYTEMGMYGYSIDGFEPLTRFFNQDISNKKTFIPDSYELIYNVSTHQEVQSRLDSLGNNMLYIQGEYDPWSSTCYLPTEMTNSRLFIVDEGNHKSRIKDLSMTESEAIRDSVMKWMEY